MATVTISDDQNILTVNDQQFNFNPIDSAIETEYHLCSKCDAFKPCCELQSTVESEFPFPCFDRLDCKVGNFLAG